MTNLLTRRFIDNREYHVVNTVEGERFFRRFTDALKFINVPEVKEPEPIKSHRTFHNRCSVVFGSEGDKRRITIKHRVHFWRGRPYTE